MKSVALLVLGLAVVIVSTAEGGSFDNASETHAYGAQMCEMRDTDAPPYPSNGSEYKRFDNVFDHALDEQETDITEFNQLSVNLFTSVVVLFIAVLGGCGSKTETVRVTIPKAARKLQKNVVRRLRQSLRVRAAYFEAESDDEGEAGFEKYRVTVPC